MNDDDRPGIDAPDLEDRLRHHYTALPTTVPDEVVRAARGTIDAQARPMPAWARALVAASVVALVGVAGLLVLGPPTGPTAPSDSAVRPSPSVAATDAPPSSPTPVAIDGVRYAAGQVLRITGTALGDPYEAYVGDRLYVIDVSGDSGGIQYRVEAPSGAGSEDASYVDIAATLVEDQTEPADDPCPDGVDTASELIRLRPFDRARCLAGAPVAIRDVWVEDPLVGTAELGMRGAASMTLQPEPERGSLPFSLAEGVEIPAPGWYTLQGRFGLEDESCGSATGRFRCRERFVVDAVRAGAPTTARSDGTWSRMTDAPIDGRSDYLAIPIDRGVFIWGGSPGPSATQGAIYDTAADRWTTIAPASGPDRLRPAAAWTGEEVLIWGGFNGDGGGLRYDPSADTWSTIPSGPISSGLAVGAWTGDRFLIVNHDAQTATWDPRTGDWEQLPDAPLPVGYMESVWTGSELVVLALGEGTNDPVIGAAFSPATGQWRTIAESPYDGGSLGAAPIWTGTEMLFMFHAYDPGQDRWRILEMEGCDGSGGLAGVWTGRLVLSQAVAYDPVAGRCYALPESPIRTDYPGPVEIRTHEFHTPVWDAGRLIVWSGYTGLDGPGANPDGIVFEPAEP